MITPEQIDQYEFKTTRLSRGYDADEVDNFLDRIIKDYRQALYELGMANQRNVLLTAAPTQQIPTVYSDMDRLLAVAQETADKQIAAANGTAGSVLAEAQGQADAIVAQGHAERHGIIGKLEVQRTELEQAIQFVQTERATIIAELRGALTALGES